MTYLEDRLKRPEPRIYVACLAAYNSGKLHGEWIDAEQDAEDTLSDIAGMLSASPVPFAEEWAIHDYEGFAGIKLSEYESIERVAQIAAALAEYGEPWAVWAENVGLEGAAENPDEGFTEAYMGEYDSPKDFAYDFYEQTGGIPDSELASYIDWRAVWEGQFNCAGYYAETINGSAHIFAPGG